MMRDTVAKRPKRKKASADAIKSPVGAGKISTSNETYDRLTGAKPGLKDFLTGPGPDFEGIDLSREPLASRDAGV